MVDGKSVFSLGANMNAKAIIPLVVAIVLGVIAAKLGKDMMGKKRATEAQVKMVKIVVARDDIAPGTTLSESDLTLGTFVADSLPERAYSVPAELSGRVVTWQLVKGQAIYEPMLAPKGTVGGAASIIPDGMRAVTLEVNEFSGVAGLIIPGSRVDIVQTIRNQADGNESMMAKTIVENLKVLAVGKRVATVGPEPEQLAKSVTVLATQEQAEVIDLVAHMGNPRLVLRNSLDEKITGGKGVTVAELKGLDQDGGPKSTPIGSMVQNLLSTAKTAATQPAYPREVIKTASRGSNNWRDVEVIRAGAVSRVKVQKVDNGVWTGSGEEIEELVPEENK
jgi:pilus assembly protein CpaB